ncbi:hypothetical protein VM98_37935, partial [Streptomyces rubellomurinus subsp. indigoferus]
AEGGASGDGESPTGRHRRPEAVPDLDAAAAAPVTDTTRPVEVPPVVSAPAGAASRTEGGLPRRVRQANLAPQLKA